MRQIWFLMVLLCLAISTAQAQDLVKVAPKNIKVEIDNPEVRVLSVHFGPHEKVAIHEHPDDVIVFLTDAHVKHTYSDGKTGESQGKAGQVIWRASLKHAAENLSDKPFDLIEIELKAKPAAPKAATTKPAAGK